MHGANVQHISEKSIIRHGLFFHLMLYFSFSRPFDLSGIFFFQPNLNGKRRNCTSFHYRLVFFL